MDSDNNDWEQQLGLLRAMTASTGTLHDAQVLQIKTWGSVVFWKSKWVANVNVDRKIIEYKILDKKKIKTTNKLAQYIAGLDRSVQWLLGGEWMLQIKQGDKLLYKGQRDAATVKRIRDERIKRSKAAEGSATAK